MALVPHPDDAEFFAGGTLAKMAQRGDTVIIVTATNGNKGSFELPADALAQARATEARQAGKILGASEVILLGHDDMGLDLLPPGTLREQFVRLIRLHRPEVVVAEDVQAADPHPDHRAVASAASDAIAYASLPLVYPQHLTEGLQPHFVTEKFFYSEPPSGSNRVVDISATFGTKIAALLAHQSQVIFLVEDIMRQARLAGIDLRAVLGEAALDPSAALTWAMERSASETGAGAGFRYGEAFRYARFHPLVETMLAGQPGEEI
jgi:LmbE family N-acetylglucosaminyl deacetylase